MGKMAISPLPYRGSQSLQSRGAKSEVAHLWAKWLPHPCRIGDPHHFTAGGKIRSGPQVGKMATSPLPYRGSPPLQSTGAKSEVAHKWAKWLPHPCRIGDPHRFRARGQNQKWPTSGQNGYLTPAVSGIPTASEHGSKIRSGPQVGKMATSPLPYRRSPPLQSRGAKSEVAHKWAKWLPHPCRIGDPHRFRAGGENQKWPTSGQSGYLTPTVSGIPTASQRGGNQKWPTSGQSGYLTPAVSGIPTASEHGSKIRSGPLVGKMATSPLPYRGSPPLQSGGQNQKSPTSGQSGYLTPAVSGIPTASQRGAKSEVAHLWSKWLPHPCRIGDPHRFGAGGKIRSGPLVGKMATSPLPSRGSPPLQSGGQNQKWHKSGQSGYVTPAVSGIPTASEQGGKIRSGPLVGKMATSPLPYRGSPPLHSGGAKSEVADKWAKWLPHPCRIGDPHRFRARGQNQKWPTSRQNGYLTPAVSGIPTASERGAKSEVAHKWAKWLPQPCRIGDPTASQRGPKSEVAHKWEKWLPHPCRIGDPHRFRAGGKIRSGPQVGKMATSPLPYRGSPPLQSGGQNQKWPTCGQNGYPTPAVSGIPPLHSGGQNQKWPTCRQNGYLTPAVSGIPTASERGAKSEVAHKWAKWLPHPCRIGDPHRFRARGQNQKWPTSGQKGYLTPAVSGIPTASEQGGKIRSGPQVGKMATSPLPYRGSPPLQSGGQNQKWPTSGQNGYLTPAVSGIPPLHSRGAKSEVAHKWAKWLPHPCRIGDPHRFRAGGKIRSGPQVGKMATSPLPYRGSHRFTARAKIRSGPQVGKMATSPLPSRGSPPLQSGGQNQKWPTSGQNGYLTPAVSGIPTASEQGAKSEVAHKWAKWLPHPCCIGDPHRFRAGGKIRSGPQVGKMATSPLPYRGSPPLQSRGAKSEVAHKWAKWLPHPCRIGDPHRFRAGGKIRSGPQVGKMATSPLPYRGSPPLQSGGQNQKWPTSGQNGYLTPAVSGIPTASEQGAKSEVAHKWAKWLPHPCRIGDPHRFRAGSKIRSGPQVGKMATSPLPYQGSPPLQSRGQSQKCPTSGQNDYLTPAVSGIPTAAHWGANQRWPTCGQNGYLTPAVSGIPTASQRGAKSEVTNKWAKWLPHPCRIGDPHRFTAGGKSEVAHKWAKWLPHPCRIGDPHRFTAGGKSEVAHKWAKWLPHPCRIGDPNRFTAGGKIRSGPQVGKVATSPLPYRGSPPLQSRGAKSEVAHKWAKWLPHPCRIGDSHRFKAGGKIRSGPQVGKMATSPLPYRGSPPLRSGGQNQRWPTSGQNGYLTPAVSGDPHRFRAGGKIRSGPQVGKMATSPLPYRGFPPLQSGGQNQKWPTSEQNGYLTPIVSGIPTASEHRSKIRSGPPVSKMATSPLPYRGSPPLQSGGQNQKWPTSGQNGYLTPAVSGIPTASEHGSQIRSGPLMGKMATSPLPYRGSPPLQSGGQYQKWPTCGQNGYLTPAVSGIPNASERGAKSEVTHKWAKWLPQPCRIGDPQRFTVGGKIRSGRQVGKVATSPLPYRDSHRFRAGGKIRSGPQGGKMATSPLPYRGSPPLQNAGAKSEVAHKWAKWLPHPCRIGYPHRFRAGGKIRSGPLMGKMATSPLPYRGSPPLQSGGQNQKWPTCGQNGYLTLAVSGIPNASERGAKSEVAHKWAKWLPHPCRIGDPHRFRAGGKIRGGPQVGKMATSPLPSRGSPPLQSGGQNQKWPTCGQNGYLTPAVSGIPTASERGAKSEVAHLWAKWLPHPCRIGDPQRFRARGKIRSGPQVGKVAMSPLPSRGSPPLQSTGAKSEVAHKWAKWLPHPCRLGDPHRFRAGGKIRSGPQVGKIFYSVSQLSRNPTY